MKGVTSMPLSSGCQRASTSWVSKLGEHAVTELMLDWLDPFITSVERDRIVAWHLGVSL